MLAFRQYGQNNSKGNTAVKKRMLFNAFMMNCVVHQSPGMWRVSGDSSVRYTDLEHWLDIARLLEKGCFDGLFLADVVGTYDVYGGNRNASVRAATQFPVNDPMLLIPAMASVTKHLGFGFTSAMIQYHPFMFTRLISTLDHLTKGRVAWNIVTSYLESTGRSFGLPGIPEHDERYDMADEYARLSYQLWENSWADDAVIQDGVRGFYADPAKIRDVDHDGKYYKLHGVHLCEPSPQRTPLLFQAGASPRGIAFGAQHAECVFCVTPRPEGAGQYMRDMRAALQAQGRNPEDVLGFAYLKIITGGTEAEAQRKFEEYSEQVDYEGALSLLGGWSGIDFSALDPDAPIEMVKTNAVQSILRALAPGKDGQKWTMRSLAKRIGMGGAGPVMVGATEQIADRLEDWIDAGVDGFNLSYATLPGSFADFIEGVVPILQQRGRMQREYQPGSIREKLFPGRGPRLGAPHPAALARTPW